MNDFRPFATAVAAHFRQMSAGELYRVDIPGDDVWQAYLGAFPIGTNNIFRVRTEHDGSYDRAFIRKLGNVVAIGIDGSLKSIWDTPGLVFPYNIVAERMRDIIKSLSVVSLFRINERTLGYESSIERRTDGTTYEWFHFNAKISEKHYTKEVDAVVGTANTTIDVMRRGLVEISPNAVAAVLELIQEGLLYRGAEFEAGLKLFQSLQKEFLRQTTDQHRNTLLWINLHTAAARIRNTVIGTLLTDLSEGKDAEFAVKSYETKVAPTNYKRPTALITKSMIEDATKTIAELGYESALERRFATISDITVNNVLWVDGQVKPQMKGGLTDLLMQEVKPTPLSKLNPIAVGIQDFMKDILPQALGVEMFFAGNLQNNLMSLTAPVHIDVNPIFKWDNNFAWSYNGNITDSIKEKVKAAGGNTNAKLRVSLAWFNHDDLDLHAQCPDGHVYYAQKGGTTSYRYGNNQILDVDMNAGSGTTRTPVENLSWVNPKDGAYTIYVHQFRKRETSNTGFTIEFENEGKVLQYSYPHAVADNANVTVFSFSISKGIVKDIRIDNRSIITQGIAQEKWNIQTENFVKVNTVLHSPNYWDNNASGNKHWFFILEGCQNDEPTRGIYNEFLKPELEKHRKVFEVLGNKTKCLPSTQQLSGLGFSSTKRDSVIVKVTDSNSTKLYQINF